MSTHRCDAVVVACIDFRFQKYIQDWLDYKLKNKTYDYVGLAGSTKDIKTIITQIKISVNLHDIKEVYLIHHENCGAYGNEGTFKKHSEDLKRTKKQILDKYPGLDINLYYLHLNGTFDTIS